MTQSKHTSHVTVVGGGLVGKTAALALAQLGLKVALIGQDASVPTSSAAFDSRVYALSRSTQALLERLRVWQALDTARLHPVYDMRIYGDAGAELHFSAFQAAVPQLAWIVEASLLEAALDTALRFQPQLTYLEGRAQHLTFKSESAVLELDNHRTWHTQLLLGADGAHSWVRAQIEAKVSHRDYQQWGIVTTFRTEKPHAETAYQWFHEGEIIALLPLSSHHVSLVWSAQEEHARALLALDGTQLAAAVEKITGERFGALECLAPARGFPLSKQKVDRLIAPRVALIGDAAHVIHPLAGQGMNLGLRDVAALTEVVAAREPFRDLGDITLLRRYERARSLDIQKLTLVTDGLQRLFSSPSGLLRSARNLGMSFANTQSFLKRWLVAHALD